VIKLSERYTIKNYQNLAPVSKVEDFRWIKGGFPLPRILDQVTIEKFIKKTGLSALTAEQQLKYLNTIFSVCEENSVVMPNSRQPPETS